MTPQNFCAGMIVSWNTQFYLLCVKTDLKLKKSSYRTRCIYVCTAYGAFMCLPHMVHLCVSSGSYNKQRLFRYTQLRYCSFVTETGRVYCAVRN